MVSVNADFLGTWIAPVHFIPKYTARRKLNNGEKYMLRHIHFESGMSITGSNADVRRKIKPSEEIILLADLYNKIAQKAGAETFQVAAFCEDLSELADNLIASKGKSVVISGTNNIDIQIITNGINSLLGNYGDCIDLNYYVNISAGIDKKMEDLVNDLDAGKIKALLMYNVNPAYDYPQSDKFLSGLKKTVLTVNLSGYLNETSGKAKFECPVHHFLESWNDAEISPGRLSLSQPCINPLFNTRSFQDSLLKWSENPIPWNDYLMTNWEKDFFPQSTLPEFRRFWDKCLSNGVFSYDQQDNKPVTFKKEELSRVMTNLKIIQAEVYEVVLYESIALGTGKVHSSYPLLMELPDPISKHCWDNVAAISPKDAEKLGILTGHLIKLGDDLILPAFIQPGQAEGTVSVALGYGHINSGPVADNIGLNGYPLIRLNGGNRYYGFTSGRLENTLKQSQLALTQVHHSMEGRPIVRETTLGEYLNDPHSGNQINEEYESGHRTLYPEVSFDGFHWGMSVDLNSCTGCGACIIACQAENNIPVVGKAEVAKSRIMHWIRIDRYYAGNTEKPDVVHQPVLCMHCDNAPCENVCPVSATPHSNEGLNQVAYTRCVGTKYCINNCPYKVRKFNWFQYAENPKFNYHQNSDLGRLVLNPDVTVRERGVVEKCSFCAQRIQEKKLQAKLDNRVLNGEEVQPACVQACPAKALVFGDLNNEANAVAANTKNDRNYYLLEELHTLPSVGYLTKIRNRNV